MSGALPQGRTQAEVDQVMTGLVDVFSGAFFDAVNAGRDAIAALIDAQEVLWRVGLATAIAFKSGAANELEFYGGDR